MDLTFVGGLHKFLFEFYNGSVWENTFGSRHKRPSHDIDRFSSLKWILTMCTVGKL